MDIGYATGWKITAARCRHCEVLIDGAFPMGIDAATSPTLATDLLAGRLIPLQCPHCGQEYPLNVQFAYWAADWIGIALGAEHAIPAISAIRQVTTLLHSTKPERESLPCDVRVFGQMEELIYFLRDSCSCYRQSLLELALPRWETEIEMFSAIANGFLETGEPGLAFVAFAGVVQDVPEFYFFESVQEALHLCAHAAGDRILADFGVRRTPLQELAAMEAGLHPHAPSYPELIGFSLHYDTPCDTETGTFREGAWNAIQREDPPLKEKILVRLRAMIAEAMLRHAKSDSTFRLWQVGLAEGEIQAWWKHLGHAEQQELEAAFKAMAGRELREVVAL